MDKISSNKSFGILFFVVFSLISLWPLIFSSGELRIWPIPFAIIFLVLGLMNSKFLNPLKLLWIKFGELLGKVIAPIVMALVYFIVLTPIGLIMRIFGKDFLSLKFSNQKSYWMKRQKDLGSMKRQF